jgi:hypothetical protein
MVQVRLDLLVDKALYACEARSQWWTRRFNPRPRSVGQLQAVSTHLYSKWIETATDVVQSLNALVDFSSEVRQLGRGILDAGVAGDVSNRLRACPSNRSMREAHRCCPKAHVLDFLALRGRGNRLHGRVLVAGDVAKGFALCCRCCRFHPQHLLLLLLQPLYFLLLLQAGFELLLALLVAAHKPRCGEFLFALVQASREG